MSKPGFRYRQAHPKGEHDWQLLVLLVLIAAVLLSVAIWGAPTGLPA